MSIEQKINSKLQQYPIIKRIIKRAYQVGMYAISPKIKSEGVLTRISPDDGYEYFFGYYDKSPWDAIDRFMICLRVKQTYKSVAPPEEGKIILIDTHDNKIIEIATTHSWNVQQGCMAQWLGPDFQSRIIYNDFRDGKYCSVIYNLKSESEEKVLPLPVYDVSRDGTFALSLDFSRLHRMRPGYGYANVPEKTRNVKCPDETCIWKQNLVTGEVTKLFKYTDFFNFEHRDEMDEAEHKVNHLMINPSGTRFMVLHRWYLGSKKYTRLVTANTDGTQMFNLSDDDFVSHCFWKSNNEIISFMNRNGIGRHYYLMKDKEHTYTLLWPDIDFDGHPSYSPNGKQIVIDSYPDKRRLQSVYICTEKEAKRIARVHAPFRYDNDVRCDLHPRWSRKGDKVCIDSTFEGKRGLYVMNVLESIDSE